MDDVLILLSYNQTQDANGIWKQGTPIQNKVFCKAENVTRAEFFAGGRMGLNPEFEFTIAAVDYNGERECIFHDKSYAIYRAYRTDDDYMELYVVRKGGTNGKTASD